MDLHLKGKVVVITGAGSGIGREIAMEFAREGVDKVAICGRNEKKLEVTKERLKELGAECYIQSVDMKDADQIESFAAATYEKYGAINIWINCAGTLERQDPFTVTPEQVNNVIQTNYNGTYFATRIAGKYMIKSGGNGSIINFSSYGAVMAALYFDTYSASKVAIDMNVRSFAGILGPYNIRVLGIQPGYVQGTEMTGRPELAENIPQAVLDALETEKKYNVLHRLGELSEVAKPVVFLASDAASYITGTSLQISGGKFAVLDNTEAWENKFTD